MRRELNECNGEVGPLGLEPNYNQILKWNWSGLQVAEGWWSTLSECCSFNIELCGLIIKQECFPVRCVPSATVALLGGYLVPGGVPGLGECTWSPRGCTWSWGVYLVPAGVPGPGGCTWFWGCTWSEGEGVPCPRGGRYSPRGQTHTCKNITFATSLRTVIISANMATKLKSNELYVVCITMLWVSIRRIAHAYNRYLWLVYSTSQCLLYNGFHLNRVTNKKAFQSNANRPLSSWSWGGGLPV